MACFFRSLVGNLNSIADKDQFMAHLTSSAFLRRVLDCATSDDSFIKSANLMQVFNKIFQEVHKIQTTGEEKDLKENLNDFLSDDEKDEVILDDKESPFASENHIELYSEFLPKIVQILEAHSCKNSFKPN